MYIYNINKNSIDSHQISPAYMLTCVRFDSRSQENNTSETRKSLVIINDAISINVNSNKKSHNHQLNIHLLGGDINYSTALSPGDFICVNLLNSTEKLFGNGGTATKPSPDSLYSRALNEQPINKKDDGFKGVFRVQSVRRSIQVIPGFGGKTLIYNITASAFTEFNQVVYFNPYLALNSGQAVNNALYVLNVLAGKEFGQFIEKGQHTINNIFKKLIYFFIGDGENQRELYSPSKPDVPVNHNKNFVIPANLMSLINIRSPKNLAADMYNYWIGIQEYSNANTPEIGLNPNYKLSGNFYESQKPPPGNSIIQAECWANVTVWSILSQYINSLLNELYTSFKLMPDGYIMPCVVLRQKPYSSPDFDNTIPHTKFLSLPTWKVSLDLVESLNLGRDESARINFVHVITKSRGVDIQNMIASQSSNQNFQLNEQDILKHGLRPIIQGCDFDFPSNDNKLIHAQDWNKLLFDWLRDGQLKENGTVQTVGIEEPISIGDNFQLQDTIYHIESISHQMGIDANGNTSFKTNFQLSFGVENNTTKQTYPEMEHTDAYTYHKDDYAKKGILPGFSDSQDIINREDGEEIKETQQERFK